jgi:hypothetical protein
LKKQVKINVEVLIDFTVVNWQLIKIHCENFFLYSE